MKKIILFILLFCATKSFAQFPINAAQGTQTTTVLTRGISASDSGYWYRTAFADTTALNRGRIDEIAGVVARTSDNSLWLRNNTATGWIQLSGGSGSVNIYNTSSTLTGNRTVSGNNLYNIAFDAVTTFRAEANAGTGKISSALVSTDSIFFQPNEGIFIIDSLASGASTDSVLVWTQATGRVKKRSYSSFTPTWQQTLTAGSTLTGNNDVSLGTTRLRFLGDGIGGGKLYGEQLREVYLQADNGTTPQLIHLMGAGDRIELSSTGTYETGLYTQHNVYSDTIPQITLYAGDVPSQVKNWTNPTAVRVRRNELAFVLNNARLNNFRIFAPERTSDTAWKAMAWNPADSTVKMFNNWQQLGITVPISSLTAATGTNDINNADYQQSWRWNTLTSGVGIGFSSSSITSGNLVGITSNSSDASSNSQRLLVVSLSGANTNSSQTTYSSFTQNTHTGTSSTNIAGYFASSGGTNNYAIIVPASSGSVGIGTSTPSSLLHVNGTAQFGTAGSQIGRLQLSGNTSGTVGITTAAAAGSWTLTLPTVDGDANQVLTTDGSGVTSWTTPSSGVTGSGTDNYIPQWNGTTALENSSSFINASGDYQMGSGLKITGSISNPTGNGVEIDLNGSGQAAFRAINRSGPNYIDIIYEGTNHQFKTGSWGASPEAMRIESNGRVGIGTTSPTAVLHLKAGTATANTAPLKLTTGTLNTTAEAGAIEYSTPNFYVTAGDAVRYTLAKTLTATATLDFGNTAAGVAADLTITVTGAADGDAVYVGAPNGSVSATDNVSYWGWVSAANTVTVRFNNNNLVAAVNPASGTFRVVVTKY